MVIHHDTIIYNINNDDNDGYAMSMQLQIIIYLLM